jgi:phosphopantetheinyl transferase (holo-ACP synthase)
MLGNDIVDLTHPDAVGIHPRFAERVCSNGEIQYLKQYQIRSPEWYNVLWTFWSIKEAAYKAVKRYYPDLTFRWKAFDTAVEPGKVHCPYQISLNTKKMKIPRTDSLNSEFIIHTTAFSSEILPKDIDMMVRSFNPERVLESEAVRDVASRFYTEKDNITAGSISWCKNSAGAPVGLIGGKPAPWLVSFSHHGKYIAWAGTRPPRF